MNELAPTRRDFLVMAGMGAAGATLVRPSKLFAAQVKAVGAVKPEKILVAADAHPAIQSAAKILAKKLQLDESAMGTYDGAPKAVKGAMVLALAKDGKLAAVDVPKRDGYAVMGGRDGAGIVVYGRAAAEFAVCGGRAASLGWITAQRRPCRTAGSRSLPAQCAVASGLPRGGAGGDLRRELFYREPARRLRRWRRCRTSSAALSEPTRRDWCRAPRTTRRRTRRRVKEFHDADVEVYRAAALRQQLCDVVGGAVCGDAEGVSHGKGHAAWRTRTRPPRCARAIR